jgi:AraC-like DNA-binding protein
MTTRALERHTMAASYALHLLDLLERWPIAPDRLLEESGIRPETLVDPTARLPVPAVLRLIELARRETREPGLGILLGYEMRTSWHGFLGFALMSASTLRQAIELTSRFAPIRTTALGLRLGQEGDQASIAFDELAPLGAVRDVVVFALLIGLWQTCSSLTGRALPGSAELAFAEPDYARRFASLLPAPIRFSRPRHRLLFDAACLDLPLPMADRNALRLASDECQRELDAIGRDGDVVAVVRDLIAPRGSRLRSLDEVACLMRVSVRTLKRRLAARGTTYKALVDQARRDRAMLLLGSGRLSVEEVAGQLGYRSAANFARAFRRLTGTTPSAWRGPPSISRTWPAG